MNSVNHQTLPRRLDYDPQRNVATIIFSDGTPSRSVKLKQGLVSVVDANEQVLSLRFHDADEVIAKAIFMALQSGSILRAD